MQTAQDIRQTIQISTPKNLHRSLFLMSAGFFVQYAIGMFFESVDAGSLQPHVL